ncbi:hypothetical protein [Pseudoclavibacter endophyticus]|uniref:Uncharacterized protein n=1 Tax=Pseudoclavibacter endophyticus TaxID=1778590 RepID=A0A6H9WF94_9MICO|nr:hypothetical protein [Pseudoclavibacter endophyticus]KAB1649619.1 hypothetical protein F8O04_05075 [Pseudoclavibacter endophyticus]
MDTESLDLAASATRPPAAPTASGTSDAPFPERSTSPRDRRSDCEHGWMLESRHATSEGAIVYVRCATCGTHRVDVQPLPWLPPEALSRSLR